VDVAVGGGELLRATAVSSGSLDPTERLKPGSEDLRRRVRGFEGGGQWF